MSWCSECGSEHRDDAGACVFCDGELVASRPTLTVAPTDHTVSSIDIADLDDAQRSMLELLAGSDGLRIRVLRDVVEVSAVDAADVEELVEQLRHPDVLAADEPVEWDGPSVADADPRAPTVAGRPVTTTGTRLGARIANWVADAIVLGLGGFLLSLVGGDASVDGLFLSGGLWLVEVALVGRFGWDFGKLVIGLRVVDRSGRPPGFLRAAVRTAVLFGPAYAASLAAASLGDVSQVLTGAFTMVSLLWLPAILWSIANDDLYQGWHDHVAGTFVVDR
jgi:uncharacterized RDD family membrane protein YckC